MVTAANILLFRLLSHKEQKRIWMMSATWISRFIYSIRCYSRVVATQRIFPRAVCNVLAYLLAVNNSRLQSLCCVLVWLNYYLISFKSRVAYHNELDSRPCESRFYLSTSITIVAMWMIWSKIYPPMLPCMLHSPWLMLLASNPLK